ncbi:hypothetical protein X765_24680 [Mesorhizobium sp. LSHC440B00]|nr:hypothetical protein X765_24680 [Mesorhizobium sp. LSHC440B00]ESX33760.1 hypothetical protein X763_24155 [Mesorhizobium sp. LSHC432A00]ESX45018.1 hypothetical protein X764_07085 [Mesorhizobium sp. LSHC440A00]
MRTLVRTSRCMASHTGRLGSGRPSSSFLQRRVAVRQRLLAKTDAVSRPQRFPQNDLVVGPEAETASGDGDAGLGKAPDHLVAAVEADQRMVEKVRRLERASVPVEIGFRRAAAELDIADLARRQLVLRRLDHADGDVGIPSQQVLDLVRGDDLDLDAGFLDAEPRRHPRQHIGRHHLAGGNAHRAFDRLDRAQCQ